MVGIERNLTTKITFILLDGHLLKGYGVLSFFTNIYTSTTIKSCSFVYTVPKWLISINFYKHTRVIFSSVTDVRDVNFHQLQIFQCHTS